jgi:cyclopropane fatty-acyl-phospholipid synthase-like methyltransferase
MRIKKCRICLEKNLSNLFSLGKLNFTGKFTKNFKTTVPKAEVALVMCSNCKLVQLNQNFNPNYLYGKDYGYRTGINSTMTNHVKNLVKTLTNKLKFKKGDAVLDIASNDGTLLNFYNRKIYTVGIDPLINKFKSQYKSINAKVPDFFSYKSLINKKINKSFKAITALSMFYDLPNPNQFLLDIKKILATDGIFILEQVDLLSIVKEQLFDTICHEHLEYYSSKIIIEIAKNNHLRVFDLKKNDINGGSITYYICHKNAKFKTNLKKITSIVKEENRLKLEKINTYKKLEKNIIKQKIKLISLIKKIIKDGKIIHGYGASTKGNVLLQYFKITNKFIKYIADRNPKKSGFYTPGTKIKIITEEKSRKIKPDYYLVLPWHFKKEILQREKRIMKSGTKLIFPLPKLEVK